MKTSNKILTTTFLVMLFCVISTMAYVASNTVKMETISAEGPISKRHYDIKDLHTLNISTGKVTLHQGEPYVEVKCADNIHEHLITEVENGKLNFKIRNGQYENLGNIEIIISTKNIETISLWSSSSLSAEVPFQTDEINIFAHNSTSINLPLEANIINVNTRDGAEINLSGKGNIMNANTRNSGNIDASNLEVNVVNADISDGSKLITTVKENLVVNVSNSGEILYKGDPEVKINSQANEGKVTKL